MLGHCRFGLVFACSYVRTSAVMDVLCSSLSSTAQSTINQQLYRNRSPYCTDSTVCWITVLLLLCGRYVLDKITYLCFLPQYFHNFRETFVNMFVCQSDSKYVTCSYTLTCTTFHNSIIDGSVIKAVTCSACVCVSFIVFTCSAG